MEAAVSAQTMEVNAAQGNQVSVEPLSPAAVPSGLPADPTSSGAAAPPVAPRIVDLSESKMMFSSLGLPAPLVPPLILVYILCSAASLPIWLGLSDDL